MSDTDRVVVGYDGDSARDALAFGAAWARSSGDRMSVVTVHPGAAPPGWQRVDAEWAAYEREAAEQVLQEAAQHVPPEIAADYLRIDAGSAAHGLSDLVEPDGSGRSPLLVVGSRRRRERRRTFPGSTAHRLLHGAGSPVVVVPWGYDAAAPERISRVAVGFVDTPDGREALRWAARAAKHLGATLTLLSVVPDTRIAGYGESREFADNLRAEYGEALDRAVGSAAGVLGDEGLLSWRLMHGPVVDSLTELSPDEVDLLVVGSRGYGPVRRVLLGGVAHDVVRHSRVPVLVAPRTG